MVVRRLNLDSIWSREPSTIKNSIRNMEILITTYEGSGFEPELPKLGLFPVKDNLGMCVVFSMIFHSKNVGNNSKTIHSI